MKLKVNIAVCIVNDAKNEGNHRMLARLNCSGVLSSNCLPRKEEELWLDLTGDNDHAGYIVKSVFHELKSGVLSPDIYLKDNEFDISHNIQDGKNEAEALASEKAYIENHVVRSLRKQDFTKFVWNFNP